MYPVPHRQDLICLDWVPQMGLEGWAHLLKAERLSKAEGKPVRPRTEQPAGAYEGEQGTDGVWVEKGGLGGGERLESGVWETRVSEPGASDGHARDMRR